MCWKSPNSNEIMLVFIPGVVKYEGSLVDISKLMQQLERSEKARNDTEEKLKELQRDLGKNLFYWDIFLYSIFPVHSLYLSTFLVRI